MQLHIVDMSSTEHADNNTVNCMQITRSKQQQCNHSSSSSTGAHNKYILRVSLVYRQVKARLVHTSVTVAFTAPSRENMHPQHSNNRVSTFTLSLSSRVISLIDYAHTTNHALLCEKKNASVVSR
jgi:hypothetical protein